MRISSRFSLKMLLAVVTLLAVAMGSLSMWKSRNIRAYHSMQDLGIIVDTEYSPPNWIPPPIASMFRECFLVPKTAYVHFQVVGPSRINIGGQELGKVDGRKRLIELTEIAKTHGFDSVVFARINDFIEFGERLDIVYFLHEPDSKAIYFTPPEDYPELLEENRVTFSTR